MGIHDSYGKKVLTKAFLDYTQKGKYLNVEYERKNSARIDGVIGKNVAVEIESRGSKQIRGALIDLIFHNYKKKLLVLLNVHMHDVNSTAKQCEIILGKLIKPSNFRVVVLNGNGKNDLLNEDVKRICKGTRDWDLRRVSARI
jgi:hypothetical protein